MATGRNIRGIVKSVYPNGYGFIAIDARDGRELGVVRDIYFHVSSLLDLDYGWDSVQIGQSAIMQEIHHNGKGWQATGVELK